jgi:ribosomal-protein-alanine N-acetyltransferase
VVSALAGGGVTFGWTLRRMVRADLPAILAIEQASFPSPWSVASFETELRAAWAMPTVAIEPMPEGERLVGYACAWHVAEEVQLLNVAVHPARRRRGVGEALVAEVLRQAGARRARSVVLEVRVANVPARRLYARLGFRTTGIRRDYYGPGQDGMVMEWRLGG